jgi:hypothetical protein
MDTSIQHIQEDAMGAVETVTQKYHALERELCQERDNNRVLQETVTALEEHLRSVLDRI